MSGNAAHLNNTISDSRWALTGIVPGLGQSLLRDCLGKVHKDIITCWNFKGEVLKFQVRTPGKLMRSSLGPQQSRISRIDVASCSRCLYRTQCRKVAPNDCSAKCVRTVAHPYILILSVMGSPEVQRLLIAYIVDLIKVLIELFNITIRPELALTATWTELQAAFELYEKSTSCQRIHERIRSETTRGEQMLVADDISSNIRALLRE